MNPVNDIVKPLNAKNLVIPAGVWTAFLALHKVHRVWRWGRLLTTINAERGNFERLIAGHALAYLIGHRLLARVCAQVVLVTHRTLACAEQQRRFSHAYHDWKKSITLQMEPPPFRGFDPLQPPRLIGIHIRIFTVNYRIKMIAVTTLYLFKEGFVLSMCSMDLIEAFSLSSDAGQKGLNEVFINSHKILVELTDNRELLLEQLQQHRKVVALVLTKVGTTYTVDDLSEALKKVLIGATTARRASDAIPERITDHLKDGLYTLGHIFFGRAPQTLLPRRLLANAYTPLPSTEEYYIKDYDESYDPHFHQTCETGQQPRRRRYYPPAFPRRENCPAESYGAS